ncbi:hypothetical protein Tco_0071062 [Tanacetum coccineum]
MAAPVICIFANYSEESVGSSPSIIILSDTVMPAAIIPLVIHDDIPALSAEVLVIPPIALEAEAVVVTSPTRVLVMVIYSSTDSGSLEDPSSPEHAPSVPSTSPFLFSSDSFEISGDYSNSDPSKRPSLLDLHEAAIAQWRSKVALHSFPSESLSSSSSTPVDTTIAPHASR